MEVETVIAKKDMIMGARNRPVLTYLKKDLELRFEGSVKGN